MAQDYGVPFQVEGRWAYWGQDPEGNQSPFYIPEQDVAGALAKYPQASGNGKLIDAKYATDAGWGNTSVDGGDAYKWSSPSGAKGKVVMTANGPMFQLPEDANTNYVTRDTNQSALGNFVSNLAEMGLKGYGMYTGVQGLGNLFGSTLSSLAGSTTPSVTSGVQNYSFTPDQQVGGWSTTASGDNMGEWDWLDQALQGDNNGIDFPVNDAGNTTQSWANGDWIDQNVATNNGGLASNWADSGATTAPGMGMDGTTVTAPMGVAGSNVYGNPLDVLKSIYNGSIPLSSLFGSGGGNTSNAGPVQPGTNNNMGNLISALFGYQGQQALAQKLLEASKYATDKADPFASQRPFYQGELQKLYTDPNALMNNSLFSGARDQAMNQAQRMLASKGYSGSGNEALQMMKAGTQAQTQYAIPYLQQTSTNAGASFGPGAAGQVAQSGLTGAAQAGNNANGYLGYGLNQIMGGNNNQSSLDQLYGRIGQGVLSNMMGGGGNSTGMRI